MPIKKVVVLFAGLATRCLPISKVLPKAMIPILNKPVLHYIVEELQQSGFTQCIFVVRKSNGKIIKDYLKNDKKLKKILKKRKKSNFFVFFCENSANFKIKYIFTDKLNGSGGAVLCAKKIIKKEDFAVFNGDDIFEGTPCLDMIKIYEETKSSVVAVKKVSADEISNYGIVENDGEKITKIIEKPKQNETKSNLAIVGRYILKNSILSELKQIKPNQNGEIGLTDAISNLLKKEIVQLSEIKCERYDCGNTQGIFYATLKKAKQNKEYKKMIEEILSKK